MTSTNGTLLQYFHWYLPPESNLWEQLRENAPELARAGFTALWLPPAYKGSSGNHDVGYGVYDLFDLGEFDQKGSVPTKYGTRGQLLLAIAAAQKAGMQVYADTVFNHRDGGDLTETIEAVPVASDNRNYELGAPRQLQVWSHFTFPGRGEKYSSMKWHWWHFDSINHNADDYNDKTIYRIKEKQFETPVDPREGNYDFLMACDLDMGVDQVQGELRYWGDWFLEATGVDGFRFDAVKHIRFWFFNEWLDLVRHSAQRHLFAVGEYWSNEIEKLHWFISETAGRMSLFDVPLHYHFHQASLAGQNYDLRRILDGTLVHQQPTLAVTFVENHDSQPCQSLESVVEPWFKPLAYALILLRQQGYPCVFYGDYYGANYPNCRGGFPVILYSHRWLIDKFLQARKHYTYGPQYDYFDHPNTIGWTCLGDQTHPQAMAVLLSNGSEGHKWMEVGRPNVVFHDLTEHISEPIFTNADGWGEFRCPGGSVSVWVEALPDLAQ